MMDYAPVRVVQNMKRKNLLDPVRVLEEPFCSECIVRGNLTQFMSGVEIIDCGQLAAPRVMLLLQHIVEINCDGRKISSGRPTEDSQRFNTTPIIVHVDRYETKRCGIRKVFDEGRRRSCNVAHNKFGIARKERGQTLAI